MAGVGKKEGAKELRAAAEAQGLLDPLQAFRPGMTFSAAGGVEAVYNDSVNMELEIDGHRLFIGPNILLKPSTYRLGVTQEYNEILNNAELIRHLIHDRNVNNAFRRGVKNNNEKR